MRGQNQRSRGYMRELVHHEVAMQLLCVQRETKAKEKEEGVEERGAWWGKGGLINRCHHVHKFWRRK